MIKNYLFKTLVPSALVFFTATAPSLAADKNSTEIVIDSIVASIDGKPITLQDLSRKAHRPALTLKEAAANPEVKAALDNLILEQLMEEEAQRRKLSVTEADIEGYISEVARRNNLDRPAFEKALAAQGKSFESYKTEVKAEILKSRLAGQIFQGGVGVSSDEIDKYLKQHPELAHTGSKVKLSQILISTDKRTQDEAQAAIESILIKLKNGDNFGKLAKQFSDGPEAAEQGSLGVVVQEELNSAIFNAISPLKEGEISSVVAGADGFRIFKVEERPDSKPEELEAVRQEARKNLQQQKLQMKMEDYFTTELYKLHSVDKKI